MKLKQITKNERPREKIIEYGPERLSDTELLAIILSIGNKGEGVLELSNRLINQYGLSKLLYMNYHELAKIPGIKEAKATKLLACFEMAKRSVQNNENESFKTSSDIYRYIKNTYLFESKEVLTVLYVTSKIKLIKKLKYSNNSSYYCDFPLKKIVQDALTYDAYGIILIHNHPSGDVNPSQADIDATLSIKYVLRELDILLLDHIVISKDNYYSFDENKLLNSI